VEVLDGNGGLALARLEPTSDRKVLLRVEEHRDIVRESPLRLDVAVGFPQLPKTIDHCLPALVQLGVSRLILARVTHGGGLKKDWALYHQRLTTIARQSLKQCGRLRIPDFVWHDQWKDACRETADANARNIIFHPGEQQTSPLKETKSLGLALGPEGGFTDEEVQTARDHGFVQRGMGPRILELETALTGAAYWAQSQFGDVR
jgi:16S rRNA (uracil1498-N3)-methyltransferase